LNISVFGLGKLGLPLAALLANSGNKVIGVDKSDSLVSELTSGSYTSSEPGLEHELSLAKSNIEFTTDFKTATDKSDIAFIIVPTPSNPDGSFSNNFVKEVIQEISRHLINEDKKFIFNIVSTVMPGTCETELIELIESETKRKISINLGITYNPEFIALGSVVTNMKRPDMHLIGAKYVEHGEYVNEILSGMSEIKVQEKILTLTEAEIVKISVNNFITMKIQFANSLFQISSQFSGVNIDRITESIGLDTRIGSKYLKSGTPFGGPCFPRDTRAMTFLAQKSNLVNSLSRVVELGNLEYLEYLVESIDSHFKSQNRIGILGLSYKPLTHVTEESAGIGIAQSLIDRNRNVLCWDENIINLNSSVLQMADSLENFVSEVDCIVITRPLLEYTEEQFQKIRKKPILDLWRTIN